MRLDFLSKPCVGKAHVILQAANTELTSETVRCCLKHFDKIKKQAFIVLRVESLHSKMADYFFGTA